MATKITDVWIGLINPPHGVTDPDKLSRIEADMRANGWTGRPILVERYGDGYQAWTGSHRLAAARRVSRDLDIPVVVIDHDKMVATHGEMLNDKWLTQSGDDYDRLAMLVEAGDDEAAALMREEIEANEAEEA